MNDTCCMQCKRDVTRDCSWHRASFFLTWENKKFQNFCTTQNGSSVDKFRDIFVNHSKASTVMLQITPQQHYSYHLQLGFHHRFVFLSATREKSISRCVPKQEKMINSVGKIPALGPYQNNSALSEALCGALC